MKIKVSVKEMSHLIEKAPLNHVLSAELGGLLIADKKSWEYLELAKIRKYNKALRMSTNAVPCELNRYI